jgi:hypothetical protein
MTYAIFAREGFVTSGNPNHYDGSGLMLRELRARSRDSDTGGNVLTAYEGIAADYLSDFGVPLTEKNASVSCGLQDQIADILSDAAPEGYVFEIRKQRGNSNWGYFRCDTPSLLGTNEHVEPWITSEEFYARIEKEYGKPGVYAAESSAVDSADFLLGYDHCLQMVLPALEEELIAEESN